MTEQPAQIPAGAPGGQTVSFGEAMAGIRRSSRTATRAGAGFEIAWRFGREVMLSDNGNGHIDYTPTLEDRTATDWTVHPKARGLGTPKADLYMLLSEPGAALGDALDARWPGEVPDRVTVTVEQAAPVMMPLREVEPWPLFDPPPAALLDETARLCQHAVMRPHHYSGGPWDGQTGEHPRAFGVGHHCMPSEAGTPGVGSTWARADAWPGEERYAPAGTGDDGDTVLMVWRLPTDRELQLAAADRADWAEHRAADIMLDEADAAARADDDIDPGHIYDAEDAIGEAGGA